MNRLLRKKKSHKAAKAPDVRYLKKTQPEEFDLVILGSVRALSPYSSLGAFGEMPGGAAYRKKNAGGPARS
jgi:hypothetical protein